MDERPAATSSWWRRRARSFADAFRGLAICLRTQANARIHFVATLAAVALGVVVKISAGEWCAVILSIAAVWAAECFNTAVEDIVNMVSPEFRPAAGRIKDLAAGAVLATGMGAAAVGLIVFLPKLTHLLPPG